MIRAWHVVIGGFTQSPDRPHGMLNLWRKLGVLRGPSTCVEFRPWNADWREFAEFMSLATVFPATALVNIYAYSWGAGWGFTQLARALNRKSMTVANAVLCDPVYRHPYCFGQWRAFMPWSTVAAPDNVEKVYWYRQRENLPRGHDVVANDPRMTTIYPARMLKRRHQWCDDAPDFHRLSQIIAGVETCD